MWDTPTTHSGHTHLHIHSGTHPQHTQDTPTTHSGHAHNTLRTHPLTYTHWDTPTTHSGHTHLHIHTGTHPQHTQDTPTTHSGHTHLHIHSGTHLELGLLPESFGVGTSITNVVFWRCVLIHFNTVSVLP